MFHFKKPRQFLKKKSNGTFVRGYFWQWMNPHLVSTVVFGWNKPLYSWASNQRAMSVQCFCSSSISTLGLRT